MALRRLSIFAVCPSMPVLEYRIEDQVRVGVGADGTDFHPHTLLVADGDAHHRAAIDSGSHELIGGFEVRIEAAIGVDARIQQHADVIAVGQNAIDKFPAQLAELLFALSSQKRFLPFSLMETLVCMPLPFTPTTGLGRKEAVSPIFVATWRQTSL